MSTHTTADFSPVQGVPVAMTIAGSDSGGGAGIQGDIKVMSALQVFGTCAITTLTAQSTTAVDAIYPVDPAFVQQQITTVWCDMPISAVKVGMLGTAPMTVAVADTLQAVRAKNLVVDPVMVAKSGNRLLQPEALQSLIEVLLPIADIVTPNMPEACDMLGIAAITRTADMYQVAEKVLHMGCKAVLVKGGHMPGDTVTDVYMDGNSQFCIQNPRVHTHNTHGTGCALSSAIAAYLARGDSMHTAVHNAVAYIAQAVTYADRLGADKGGLGKGGLGKGNGPIYHFYNSWI